MGNYDMTEKYQQVELSPRQGSTRQRLERDKKMFEDRLANVNKAIELLDKHPELEEFHEALRRA